MKTAPPFSDALVRALDSRGVAARVVLTDNRVRMLSARRVAGRVEVRVAHHLAQIGPAAVDAVAGWVAGDRAAQGKIRALLATVETPRPAPRSARAVRLTTAGRHHDLAAIARAELARYFPDLEPVPMTWGPRPTRRGQRSIRLGSYDFRRGLVRIHRRLDDPRVPAWFIGFVIYHELLHHVLGATEGPSGRRGVHTAEFRRREALHHRYAEALAWEAEHLNALMG